MVPQIFDSQSSLNLQAPPSGFLAGLLSGGLDVPVRTMLGGKVLIRSGRARARRARGRPVTVECVGVEAGIRADGGALRFNPFVAATLASLAFGKHDVAKSYAWIGIGARLSFALQWSPSVRGG